MGRTLQHNRDFKSFHRMYDPLPVPSRMYSCLDKITLSADLTGPATRLLESCGGRLLGCSLPPS